MSDTETMNKEYSVDFVAKLTLKCERISISCATFAQNIQYIEDTLDKIVLLWYNVDKIWHSGAKGGD